MDIICLEEQAFFTLIETVCARLGSQAESDKHKWVPPHEAMALLNIKSKTSLQNLRDTGQIRYSQPQRKIILYDRNSIDEYLEKHAQNTF